MISVEEMLLLPVLANITSNFYLHLSNRTSFGECGIFVDIVHQSNISNESEFMYKKTERKVRSIKFRCKLVPWHLHRGRVGELSAKQFCAALEPSYANILDFVPCM